jgi:hypothetical protein
MILEMKVPSPGESIKVEIATWLVNGDYVKERQAMQRLIQTKQH